MVKLGVNHFLPPYENFPRMMNASIPIAPMPEQLMPPTPAQPPSAPSAAPMPEFTPSQPNWWQRNVDQPMDRFARGMMNPLTTMGITMLGNAADSVRPPGRAPLYGGQAMLGAIKASADDASAGQMNDQAKALLEQNLFERDAQRKLISGLLQNNSQDPRVQLSVLNMLRR